jgi:C4-type Zn-finger protein
MAAPRLDAATMNLSDDDLVCPVCDQPMRLLATIRRVPGEQTLVLQCRPCGLSTTKTIDGAGPRDTTH